MSTTILPIIFSVFVLSKVIILEAFTEHRNLVLNTPSLTTGSHVTTSNAQIIWIYKNAFASQSNTQKLVWQIQNEDKGRTCDIKLVSQKIRSRNAEAKLVEEISDLLKKNYFYLGLEKKKDTALQDGLASYIKAVRYGRFFFPNYTVPILN